MFKLSSSAFSALVLSAVVTFAYDPTRNDNLVVYWGQNSYGETHGSDTPNWQKTISNYCQVPAFYTSVAESLTSTLEMKAPFSTTCNDNGVSGSCASLAAGIQACQAKGKLVTLSLGGGGTTTARFATAADAVSFADTIWNDFLGGSSGAHRPFGAAVLDGVDLDIESGTETGYVNRGCIPEVLHANLNSIASYYLTAAPQCPYPDAWVGCALNTVPFDAVYVQFYKKITNSGLKSYPSSGWNYATWNTWAIGAPNPNVKIFIGAPASTTAANAGEYVSASTLGSIALATRGNAAYSHNFGGVMLCVHPANSRFDQAIKNILTGTTNCGAGASSNPCTHTYTVKSGDTCSIIEAQNGISDAHLHALNPAINSGCTNLAIGQILCI
ncbi:glycoside hydrolase family 18 protein [Mycena albidolilacea]|uniref:chitinase n=1 Tax=Mycena albidolilacea TaxID=1033008 RepID=A0AAD6Z916_9AGAR|nr:glycoside hydrolase family 18 protein [Mycena albidolilacea]